MSTKKRKELAVSCCSNLSQKTEKSQRQQIVQKFFNALCEIGTTFERDC